jgi:uncharacterized glyoxalase superfamily protein PhnB
MGKWIRMLVSRGTVVDRYGIPWMVNCEALEEA